MDSEEDAPGLEILRDAFVALSESHPELVAKLSAVMESSRGERSALPVVEAGFREAARALLPTDRDAAETLFVLAEVLAQYIPAKDVS